MCFFFLHTFSLFRGIEKRGNIIFYSYYVYPLFSLVYRSFPAVFCGWKAARALALWIREAISLIAKVSGDGKDTVRFHVS